MKICVNIKVWQRPEVFRATCKALRAAEAESEHELLIATVLSTDDPKRGENLDVANDYDCALSWAANIPLSTKANWLSTFSRKLEWDYLMVMGSDDVVSPNFLGAYDFDSHEAWGWTDMHLWAPPSSFYYWPGYDPSIRNESIGAGRVLSRDIVKRLDWRLHEELAKRVRTAHKRALDRAAGIGTLVHNFAEKFILGQDPKLPRNKLAARCAEQFLKWFDEHKIEPLHAEFRCISLKHWYAGTSDLDCMMDGVRTMVDFKTSKRVYDKMGGQLAAYCKARKEELGFHFERRVIALFPKEGATFETREFEDFDSDWKAFRACRDLYEVRKESTWKNRRKL